MTPATARVVDRGAADGHLPDWVPVAARHYLAHVTGGAPIRALAREAQVHASTVLRQVRRFETLRDDPLVDEALHVLARHMTAEGGHERETTLNTAATGIDTDGAAPAPAHLPPSETRILREGARILRRLNEARTVLAIARDMEMGVVVREGADGAPERLAVVGRDIAQAMALKDWIACTDPSARIIRYRITACGRQMLRSALHGERRGMAEAPAPFAAAPGTGDRMLRHMRSLLGDSPVTVLARRRGRDGTPWLSRGQITAAERLREDFELSRSGPRAAMGWEAFLAATGAAASGAGLHQAEREAHARLAAALRALGPGLADAALRCCCFLEGLECVEEQMGWSARSGKVVLRVALDHLQRHYTDTIGRYAPPIG